VFINKNRRSKMNRETWLNQVTEQFIRPLFISKGFDIPKNVRLTCGLPSQKAFGMKQQRIGECWSDIASKDGHFEIMISPTIADNQTVTSTLIHELVHATVGLEAGHKKPFKQCAVAVGLTGKMTATTSTDELKTIMNEWFLTVGDYPHAVLSGMTNGIKKQSTRMIKCECEECGYTVRMTRKWLAVGVPNCPQCDIKLSADNNTDEGEDE
jgi:hypothetical protein